MARRGALIRRKGLWTTKCSRTRRPYWETYNAITYLEPFDARNAAARVMMFSPPRCGAPPDRGNERFGRGCVAIGGKVKLVDETSENAQADVPMYIRYYRRTGIPDTLDKRRSSLVGYVYAPFRFNDFIQAILCRIGRP